MYGAGGGVIPETPVQPLAGYLGGKKALCSRIIPRLRAIPHQTYVEPFIGMGGIFLRRPFRAKVEVINDINRDIANLFRVVQRHHAAFIETLRWQLTSRADFERLLATAPDTLTDLERAARFLYLQRTAFGSRVVGQNFGVSVGHPGRFDVTKLASMLEAVHERLAGVVIERLPWPELLTRYDRPATLFYLDPPYWGNEDDYGKGVFGKADFERMADMLAGLRGQFLLSINDCPEIRHLFRAFTIERVETSYRISAQTKHLRVSELLISARKYPLGAG